MGTDEVLCTDRLTKIYAGKAAVDRVSMHVKKGDIYGLIGKNGAGKTTLIRLVTGLAHPDEGRVELFGESEQKRLRRARSRLGCIVDMPALYPHLTAEQNLEYFRIQQGIPDRKCVSRAMERVGLAGIGKERFDRLSLGMKQRLGLALAILNDPDFVLLDEPINGLDPVGIAEIRETLQRLNEEMGITLFISSHILSELYLLATTYGIIHSGNLVDEFSRDRLDEECRRCLRVTVDDVQAAVLVLETVLRTTRYKVIGRQEIRIYDYLEDPAEVTAQLSAANIRVSSIHEMGANLEDYFRKVIREAEQDA